MLSKRDLNLFSRKKDFFRFMLKIDMAGGQNLKKNISGNENLKILKIALNYVLNVELNVEHDSKIRFLRSFKEKKL